MKTLFGLFLCFNCLNCFSQSKPKWVSDTVVLENGFNQITLSINLQNKRKKETKIYTYNLCKDKVSYQHQIFRESENRITFDKNKMKKFKSNCSKQYQ